MLDLIIRNGRVIDTKNNIDKIKSIGIKEGKIHSLKDEINDDSIQSIDAKGCIVVPGLIDFHTHLFSYGLDNTIPCPDAVCFPSGVTTAIDGGSSGVSNYEIFKRRILSNSKVRMKSFLYIGSEGQVRMSINQNETLNPKNFNREEIKRLFEKNGDDLLGLKVKFSKETVGDLGIELLREVIKIANEIGCRIVVHTTNLPVQVSELVEILREGDVYCHVFQGKNNSIIGDDGQILSAAIEGRRKGIIFDAANGFNNSDIKVTQSAIKNGFLPDIISSDISAGSFYRKEKGVFSLQFVLSKYLNMGVELRDIIKSCTEAPAQLIGDSDIGTLEEGASADICILKIIEKKVEFVDSNKNKFIGNKLLKNEVTIKDGIVVFRQIDF